MSVRFDNLGLSENLQKTVTKNGYSDPTPVQAQSHSDYSTRKRSCSQQLKQERGKLQPSYSLCSMRLKKTRRIISRVLLEFLILTPTRELAAQVAENIEMLKGNLPVRVALAYGGVGINPQKKALAKGTDFLVATPGRLLDLIGQRMAKLSSTHTLVLDEADRMLDMGFLPDLKRIMKFFTGRSPDSVVFRQPSLLKLKTQPSVP